MNIFGLTVRKFEKFSMLIFFFLKLIDSCLYEPYLCKSVRATNKIQIIFTKILKINMNNQVLAFTKMFYLQTSVEGDIL